MIFKKMAECEQIIGNQLGEILAAGFSFRKRNFEYTRKRGICLDIFRVELYKRTGWYKVTPSVFIGCPAINKLFNSILKRKIPVNGETFGFAVRNEFAHTRGSYNINEESELVPVSQSVLADFKEIALPWYEQFVDLGSIDAHLNAKDESGKYVPESVSYACCGLIAAHLSGNPAFEEIADAYYQSCTDVSDPSVAQPILTTRDYLIRSRHGDKIDPEPHSLISPG